MGATAIIFTAFQICEICYKKIISITPFINYVLPTPYLISSLELVQR